MACRCKKDIGSLQEMTFDEEIHTEIIPNLPPASQLLFLMLFACIGTLWHKAALKFFTGPSNLKKATNRSGVRTKKSLKTIKLTTHIAPHGVGNIDSCTDETKLDEDVDKLDPSEDEEARLRKKQKKWPSNVEERPTWPQGNGIYIHHHSPTSYCPCSQQKHQASSWTAPQKTSFHIRHQYFVQGFHFQSCECNLMLS